MIRFIIKRGEVLSKKYIQKYKCVYRETPVLTQKVCMGLTNRQDTVSYKYTTLYWPHYDQKHKKTLIHRAAMHS